MRGLSRPKDGVDPRIHEAAPRPRPYGCHPSLHHGLPGHRRAKRRRPSSGYPSPAAAANPDGSTTVYFGPRKPAGVSDGNWIQTAPGKGWNTLLRLYSPLEPFFNKAWRPSEIELVN